MIPREEVFVVLGDLANVTDATQFLSRAQKNPELVFEAVKTLACQSVGDGTVASQLQNSYKKLVEKDNELLAAPSSLETARQNIEAIKRSLKNNDVLGKFADVLENLCIYLQRSANVREDSIFNGDKKNCSLLG